MNGARSTFMRKGYCSRPLPRRATGGVAWDGVGAERRVRGDEFHDDGGRIPRAMTPRPSRSLTST